MFWLIGIGTSLLVVSILRRKTTGRAIWLGSLVTLSLLALLCSFLLAGAAYLFLLPALVGSLLALLASLWRSRWLPAVSTFLVILAAGAALLPLAWNIWDGMGIPGMPAVTLLIAGFSILVLAPATDSLAKPSNKGALGILALAGAFLILALVLPPYCSESPRALNFYFVQDADTGEARLAARPGSRALPKELAEAVDWDTNKKNLYPWHDGPGVYITAEASALSVEPPQLEILESLETETGRLIRARLQSPRGAARGALVFPDPQRIDSLRLDGWEFDLQTDEVRSWYPDGRRVVRFATMPEQGIDLELTLQGEEPFEVFALDFSFDLPTVGDPLTNGRPPTVVPIDEGDLTIVHTRTEI
jgi:hypothetical protein